MATKRKRLPKETKQLLEAGDIEELKKQLALCEPNAISGKYGSNIFSLTPCPGSWPSGPSSRGRM